jgi:DNA polymerase-3 subunit delta
MALGAVYYLYGVEGYLIEERLGEIKAEAVAPGFESFNYQVWYRDNMEVTEVVSACETLPAFAEKRLVVVKGAQSLTAQQAEGFMGYIEDPSPSTCLVFVAAAEKVDLRSSFIKLLKEKGYLHQFRRLKEADLIGWVVKEARRQGKGITPDAARRLVETAGPRLWDLKGELDKLVLFVGDKDGIDGRDVEDSGLNLREQTVFKLTDAIGAKDVRGALKVLAKLSGEEPLMILGSIARHIRIMLKLKAVTGGAGGGGGGGGGQSRQSLASIAGVHPHFVDGYVRGAGRFTEAELKGAIEKFRSVDREFKSSTTPKGVILSRLIMELCS